MRGEVQPQRWFFVCYDQLHHDAFPWAVVDRSSVGLIFIESLQKGRRRKYHKQKLALLLSNMRHFAIEAEALGHPVMYEKSSKGYREVLERLSKEVGAISMVVPAEREMRHELEPLVEAETLLFEPHAGWLTERSWFVETVGTTPPFRMDRFYQRVRKETGVLMLEGKPLGGKYSFDSENRMAWKGDPEPQVDPVFDVDSIDQEVNDFVMKTFPTNPGECDLSKVPTTRQQHLVALQWAKENMPHFGPYEDAMSEKSRTLFHSKLATSINLHRLAPREVITEMMATDSPLNSLEGFYRQMIWREYVHHVHEVTDGFRTLESYNHQTDQPNHLNQHNPLPDAYWGAKSGFNCLDSVVESVMDDGWTHHIPRLMILSNFASLLDINPRELTTWFHEAFIDAYDWVVEPNVLGMGTFAMGDVMMTKPYVSGTPYINKMSDFCSSCSLHPKKTCTVSNLYWAYLERHKSSFTGNMRMAMPLRSLAKRSEEKKVEDSMIYASTIEALRAGQKVTIQ